MVASPRRVRGWILPLVLLATAACPALSQQPPESGPAAVSHAATASPDYERVFPEDRAVDLTIHMATQVVEEVAASGNVDVIQLSGQVLAEDEVWEAVEFETSRDAWEAWERDEVVFPLSVNFASAEAPTQRFFGFRSLQLYPATDDPALVRAKCALDALRYAGVPTPRASLCHLRLEIDSHSPVEAIYTLVETPDLPMLDSQYDEDDGSLVFLEGGTATLSRRDPGAIVIAQPADDQYDAPPVDALFDVLQDEALAPEAWRAALEDVFDVYEFLRLIATRVALGSTCGYGRVSGMASVYWDPGDVRYHWIPQMDQGILPSVDDPLVPLGFDLAGTAPEWILIRRISEDPAYYGTYLAYLEETRRGVLDVARLQGKFQVAFASIEPFLSSDDSDTTQAFPPAAEARQGLAQLLVRAEDQYAALDEFLWAIASRKNPIVISELHYNPSPDQGIDNSFEFIELYNRGNRTVDLSGYRFIEGLEFGLPPGTILRPGQCLLISKRAETYRDAPCEVQQWARGSLSNGGEVVRLVDRDGIEVDSVKYDDVAPWPEAADAKGSSLEIVDPELPNYTFENWRASATVGGSPGWVNP